MQNELEVHVDCGSVMLLSSEIVAANWIEDGRPQVPPDLIDDQNFLSNPIQRFKIKLRMSASIKALRQKICKFTGLDASQVLLIRIMS